MSAPSETAPPRPAVHDARARRFRPTVKQLAYAVALAEALANGQPATDAVVTKAAGVSRTQVPRWRQEVTGFEEWLDEFLRSIFRRGLTKVLLRSYTLALRGSIKHMEFFARYSGEIAGPDLPTPLGGASVDARSYTIVVPRPPGAVPAQAVRTIEAGAP